MVVFMEDLDYRTSAKGMFGKHMLDAAFGQFRSIVKYVCWKRGKFFSEVDARGTSQECPECGGEVKKDLSVRFHNCPQCGYKTDRDVAAGQNIRNRGIALLASLRPASPIIGTVGQTGKETACAVGLPGVEEKSSPRSEAKSRNRTTRKPKK
jgi:putative transposase